MRMAVWGQEATTESVIQAKASPELLSFSFRALFFAVVLFANLDLQYTDGWCWGSGSK